MVNGVKQPLPGLVSRRADEKRLFLKSGGEKKPLEDEISRQDKVTWLEGYRGENKKTVVVEVERTFKHPIYKKLIYPKFYCELDRSNLPNFFDLSKNYKNVVHKNPEKYDETFRR